MLWYFKEKHLRMIKSRINEPKLWLAIFLLALPTVTNTTQIKQKNDSKNNTINLKTNDQSKDIHISIHDSNSFMSSNFNKPTTNESYSNSKDYSQTNKEHESNLKSTYMAITDTDSTINESSTSETSNKDTSNIKNLQDNKSIKVTIGDGLLKNTETHNTSGILNLDQTHLNLAKYNKTVTQESRNFKKIAVDSKLESLLKIDIDSDEDNASNEKIKRKKIMLQGTKSNNRKRNEIKVEPRDITNAIEFGIKALEELVKVKEPQWYKLGLFLDKDHPAARVAAFGAPTSQKAVLMSRVGYATLEASKKIAQSYPENVGRQSAGIPDELQSRIDLDDCPLRGRPRCPPASRRFRTSDGTCNNLKHPWRGAAMLPMQRFLPPVYEDGIQSVRRSVFGDPLPSARHISTVVHRDKHREIQSVTMMFTQWGQFIDHDITSTVKARSFNGSIPRCCDSGGRRMLPPDLLHPSCLPIEVPRTDRFLSRFGIGCMEFIRSAPSTRIDCELGWREQINQVTPYIDGSTIYGSDVDTSDSIRTFRNGEIVYGRPQNQGPLNPPDPPEGELCRAGALSDECLQAGDGRFSENPGLIAMHTVFVRYHNKVATVLSQINPHWSDERVYQETRRIVYSAIQQITYREYLPVVLGPEVMDIFELRVLKKGFYDKYDKRIIPAIANSFGTAAFRFGHSMIQNSFMRADSHHIPLTNNVSLHEELSNFNNIWTFGSIDRILLGFSNQPSQRRDEFMAEELTNHLFQFSDATPFGMDLAAINIQRGRDHGIPPYTSWRKPCGLSPITDWRDLEKVMSISSVIRLKSLYRHVDDVDLFTGGLAEKPLRGGVVGPTFACIIAQQFSNLRKGDRFWFENDGFGSSFSPAQLQQIRKVSLAQIICQTTDEVETIQPFVFLSADKMINIRVSCDSPEIRNFDLGAWTEKSFEFNSISENVDPFEQERSQKINLDLIRRRRVITRHDRKTQTKTTNGTTDMKPVHTKLTIPNDLSELRQKLLNYPPYPTRHGRKTRSTKNKTKAVTSTKPPRGTLPKSKTKTNSTAKKLSKSRVTTFKPIQITSLPMEVKNSYFNDIPKKPAFSGHIITRRTNNKPQYYQIQDQNHDDVTYLVGILPQHTTKAPIHVTPLQVNINIQYSAHSTATTTAPIKKKRPHVTPPKNDYTYKPVSTGTYKPTHSYGQNNVVLITKRPATSTKRPVTTDVSYPIFIYNPAYDKPNSYEVTTKNPTYFFDNDFVTKKSKRPNMNGYGKPTDVFYRPVNVRPSTGYIDDHHEEDNYTPIGIKPSTTYQTDENHNAGFDKKPIYISTLDYNSALNRPASFENKPFSTSNKPVSSDYYSNYHTDRYSNIRPTGSYYVDNDDDSDIVVITNNKRRPQTTAFNRDENYFNDDILTGFFNQQYDKNQNTDKKTSNKTNTNTKTKVSLDIDGKLDFKSRVIYKKTDKSEAEEDRLVEISSVRREEFFGKEDVNKEKANEFFGKVQKKQRRSVKKIRIVSLDVMPSEFRNQWKYFNATEEPAFNMKMPEFPINMPCSYEVPKPMTFFSSAAHDT